MYRCFSILVTLTFAAGAFAVAAASAQQPQPQHQHYIGDAPDTPNAAGRIAPLLKGLGDYHFPVSTKSPEAQRFFDQGFRLTYGFNHREAIRAFKQAYLLDPDCAMCYWGHALALGPNINASMEPSSVQEAYDTIQKAVALKGKATERERAYIDAVAARYSADPGADRTALDRVYADALRDLVRRFPDDLDAATLFAEALMDLTPWNYWTKDGRPLTYAPEIVSSLEAVLARAPSHPGALHFYIHAVEASQSPERAEAVADRLAPLMPAAGHIVHRPSHIYYRVGRYADAISANERAIDADEDYITQCRAQGIYPLAYYPHNIHFLWAAASMQGRGQDAIAAARKVASRVEPEMVKQFSILQGFQAVPYFALVRFGHWDEILREPRPSDDYPFLQAHWHYARGRAFAATSKVDEAEGEFRALETIAASPRLAEIPATFSSNTPEAVVRIAVASLAGEVAAARKEWENAIAHLHRAVLYDDALNYIEPPDWDYPPRQSLGAVLLAAGRPAEAEVVYWEDLRRKPGNGWSLFGLLQALKAQGKGDLAAGVQKRFEKAWANADIELSASRF